MYLIVGASKVCCNLGVFPRYVNKRITVLYIFIILAKYDLIQYVLHVYMYHCTRIDSICSSTKVLTLAGVI